MDSSHPAFERTFTANYPAMMAYFRRRCATPEDAEDAATEVFAVAWRRRAELPPAPEDRLWLFGVARRVLANQVRGARRRDRLVERLRGAQRPHERSDPATGAALDVRRALAALGPADRELLLLIGWEQLEVREAAAVLGLPAPLVSRRLYRARRRLAHLLDPPAAAPLPLTTETQP